MKTHPLTKNVFSHIKDYFMNLQPKDYQQRVLNFMRKNPGLIVFHEMGTGKTITGLICAVDYLLQDINNTVYIVASKTLIENWRKEIRQFLPETSDLTDRIFIGTIYDFKNHFKHSQFQSYDVRTLMVIVDEAHNYKSAYIERKPIKPKGLTLKTKIAIGETVKTKKTLLSRKINTPDIVTAGGRHRVMKKDSYYLLKTIVNRARKVIFLTGTPFRNTIADIKNMVQMIKILYEYDQGRTSPHDIRVHHETSTHDFMREPAVELPMDDDLRDGKSGAKTRILQLKKMMDYEGRSGDFPPYKIFYEFLQPSAEFKSLFRSSVRSAKTKKKQVAYTRSRIASIHIKPDATTSKPTNKDTKTVLSSKVRYLLGEIPATQHELIYDNYIKNTSSRPSRMPDLRTTKSVIYSGLNIPFMEKELPEFLRQHYEGIRIFHITGNSSKDARKKAREEFNAMRENAVLLISQAANEGVDLKGVGHVFFIDGVWNPAEFEQIMGRAIRHGSHTAYPGVEVEVHILFDKDAEFPQEAMDTAVGKKYKIMKAFKDIIKDFNVQRDNDVGQVQTMVPSSFYITPLELDASLITNFDLDYERAEDDHLDVFQMLSVLYTDSIFGVIPDNCNKIFSKLYNSSRYDALESYFREFRRIYPELNISYMEFHKNKKNDIVGDIKGISRLPDKSPSVFVCSGHEGTFGHYVVMIYHPEKHPDTLFYYDSMLRSKNDDEGYQKRFREYLGRYYVLPKEFVVDFPDGPYGPDHIYSMEATGGNPELCNPYITGDEKFTGAMKDWLIRFQVLGPDNQNQFCYMWSLLYVLCKLCFFRGISAIDWPEFLQTACHHQILPIVLIKIFITLTIPVMNAQIREKWITIPLLAQYFNLILTNSIRYNDTFHDNDYAFYSIRCKYPSISNLKDAWIAMTNKTFYRNVRLEKTSHKYENTTVRDKILKRLDKYKKTPLLDPNVPLDYENIVHLLSTSPAAFTPADLK